MSENEKSETVVPAVPAGNQKLTKSGKPRKARSDRLIVLKQVGATNAWNIYDIGHMGLHQVTSAKIESALEKAAIEGTFQVMSRKSGFTIAVETVKAATLKHID